MSAQERVAKDVIGDFLSRAPKQSPNGYEPLTLERIPEAIERLRGHESTLKAAQGLNLVDHRINRLKQQVGEFITCYLIEHGADGARELARVFRKPAKRKYQKTESERLVDSGRALFLWSLLTNQMDQHGRLPTKKEFREMVLWYRSLEQAGKADPQSMERLVRENFGRLKVRCRDGNKFWRRIAIEIGVSGLPNAPGGRPKTMVKKGTKKS